ncbi:MAG: DNA-processing protein DprA [Dehalococcoidales bacterium]|nr:DNA-processing protein DprA [Dehalococcoidales bacterium]
MADSAARLSGEDADSNVMTVDMTDSELKYWVGFNTIPGIGRVKFSLMESYFGKMEDAWKASAGSLKQAGLDSHTLNSIETCRPGIDLDSEMEKLARSGVKACTYHDALYPARLKEIYDYPPVIYIKGSLLPQDEWCVAVVGTRRATVYGRQVAEEIVQDLARNNITVVSGLARGIDTVAHRRALEAGGRTCAIFACGVDTVYPAENADLARRIADCGALISEYPLGTKPRPDNFPRRNRIMSGMSLGVLVVEADSSSGAIITAHMALEQNREVFAIPGSIFSPVSRGTNTLIQEGAKLVRNCTDILEELNLTVNVRQMELKEMAPLSDTEALVLKHISAEPAHIDQVCRNSGLPISTVSSNLAIMELKGLVRQVSAMNYVLAMETRKEYKVKIE